MMDYDGNPARTADELPDDVRIGIVEVWDDDLDTNKIIVVYMADEMGRVLPSSREDIYDTSKEENLSGVVQLMYRPECDAYEVIYSLVAPGWGPLLYDIAIEQATENAQGLMSDRKSVSDMAARVWRLYRERPDVERRNLPSRRRCLPKTEGATDEAFLKKPTLSERLLEENRLLFFEGHPPQAKGGYGSFFDVEFARPKPLAMAAN